MRYRAPQVSSHEGAVTTILEVIAPPKKANESRDLQLDPLSRRIIFDRSWWVYRESDQLARVGFAAYHCLWSVMRLMQCCEEHRPEPSEMPDEELRASLIGSVREVVEHHAELAVAAARKLGWTVVLSTTARSGHKRPYTS